jgi:hypothetical protein
MKRSKNQAGSLRETQAKLRRVAGLCYIFRVIPWNYENGWVKKAA